jgi:hypothetical protein
MQLDSTEPVYVVSTYEILLRQLRGEVPASGGAPPPVTNPGRPNVQTRGQFNHAIAQLHLREVYQNLKHG